MNTKLESTTLSIRVKQSVKSRLEKLAKTTGRSRAFLAAEAIHEFLNVNEWQVVGIHKAIASLDAGGGVPHEQVVDWVASWGTPSERPMPKTV